MRGLMSRVSLGVGALLCATPLAVSGGGSSTSYEIGPGGSIERRVTTPDGTVVEVVLKGPQKCSNITVQLNAAAVSKLASLVPLVANVSGMSTWNNQDTNSPLVVQGTPVTYSPSPAVAAEAENFSPAPPGFAWQGFESNVINGSFQPGDFVEFFVKVNYQGYPSPAAIGPHMGAVYISDNAQSVQPILMQFPVYTAVPTIPEVGLAVLAIVLVGGGALLLARRNAPGVAGHTA